MAKRYIGDAVITITYRDRGDYAGTVCAGRKCWRFNELRGPAIGFGRGVAYDSPKAYDEMAESAVGFGSYYTTHNRGDAPDWAPPADVADAIEEATAWAQNDQGDYEVRRSRGAYATKFVRGRALNPASRASNPLNRNPLSSIFGKR